MASAVADISAVRFCLVGRFVAFLPGERSPYQRLSLAVLAEAPPDLALDKLIERPPVEHPLVLSKDLRRMMYRYLEPQDWVRVVGTQALNRRSGLMEWRAAEISKLSLGQVEQLKHQMTLPQAATPKPTRVLICQQADCRQRGSLAVSQAMRNELHQSGVIEAEVGSSETIIQATGCMKRCKVGPNVVIAGKVHTEVTPAQGRSLIQSI